jgi:hypothetical protein
MKEISKEEYFKQLKVGAIMPCSKELAEFNCDNIYFAHKTITYMSDEDLIKWFDIYGIGFKICNDMRQYVGYWNIESGIINTLRTAFNRIYG